MNQSKALALLKAGHNVFLTGSAGAGKTYVLNQYIKYLKERNANIAVTASTGIAATHMQGQTIHSWSGMGIKDRIGGGEVDRMMERKYYKNRVTNAHVLIIDEISMLHKRQLDMINFILKRARKSTEAFGGMQIILSGDFFQLPPVSRSNETNREKFAFMAQAWLEAKFKVCYLSTQYRASDNDLTNILNEIRSGVVSTLSREKLRATKENNVGDDPTELYTHNWNVDHVNRGFLEKIDARQRVYKAKISGNLKMAEQIKKSVIVPEILVLKVGARVMFAKNDQNGDYQNGSVGEVVDFHVDEDTNEALPVVKLDRGRKIWTQRESWSIESEKGVTLVSFEQVPLKLGWAITVHKSQGMTLDSATIDLTGTFERGQGYVALSRLRDLNGLKLLGINARALEVDELALRADARFKELSVEVDGQYREEALKKNFEKFLKSVGGTNDKKVINKHKDKKKRKIAKKSTYDVTAELVERRLTLKQIAQERGVVESTIVNHLVKLQDKKPNLEIDYLKPDGAHLEKIISAKAQLEEAKKKEHFTEEGKLRLGALYDHFEKAIPYEDLRLALLFAPKS